MEHEILLTGIGGQGIQLAARTVAEAAILDGRRVQLFASYGGMMRGGNSDAAVVVADGPVTSPPVVGAARSAIVMHHEHAAPVWAAVRPGGTVVVNSSVVDLDEAVPHGRNDLAILRVDALDVATGLGAPVAASLVAVGALVAATSVVGADALLATPERVLPSYRAQAADTNRQALQAGLDAVTAGVPT